MDVREKEEIVVVDKNENVRSESYGFPFYRKGISYGITAGLIMIAVSLIISGITANENPGWDYLKYIVLGLFLGKLLLSHKAYLPEGKIFKEGWKSGLFTSAAAAAVMFLVNFFINLAGVETSFAMKFGLEPESFGDVLAINGLLVVECVGYGLILTLIWLQLLKDPKPAE